MIELGKYAGPVLAAWGIGLVLLIALVLQSVWASRRARRALQVLESRRGG